MGKSNPIKDVIKGASDLVTAPLREGGRLIGADGITNLGNGLRDVGNTIGVGAVDLANNEKGKQQKKADEANGRAEAIQKQISLGQTRSAAAAETARIEGERMAGGSKSRTLLTGPAGLDDEENVSISRRTLSAR